MTHAPHTDSVQYTPTTTAVTHCLPRRLQVGDIRVRFTVVPPTDVSIVAKYSYGDLIPHVAPSGESVCLLQQGKVPARDMVSSAEQGNATVAWLLRLLGAFGCSVGFSLLFRPLSMLSEPLPIIRDVAELGTNVAGTLTGTGQPRDVDVHDVCAASSFCVIVSASLCVYLSRSLSFFLFLFLPRFLDFPDSRRRTRHAVSLPFCR